MKQIFAHKVDTTGRNVEVVYRIMGKIVYLKFNDNEYSQQMISQMREKGAIINEGRKWIRCNMFGNHSIVKIGDFEFDAQKETEENVESILFNFFTSMLIKSGFEIKKNE